MYEYRLARVQDILEVTSSHPYSYTKKNITVLVNSNFQCGFFIDRERLYDILKQKYRIQCIYDPCSYPGIQCKFYYCEGVDVLKQSGIARMETYYTRHERKLNPIDESLPKQREVSIMIFRTGCVLIVGMCEVPTLHRIYSFLTTILQSEYHSICTANRPIVTNVYGGGGFDKKKKRKRFIYF